MNVDSSVNLFPACTWLDTLTLPGSLLDLMLGNHPEIDVRGRATFSSLDIGGGLGAYSAVFLRENPNARATQIDWPSVNRSAEQFVGRFGVGDRFSTIDGNYLELDFGEGIYDAAILSNVAHQEPPTHVGLLLTKIRRALRAGGTLVISDFMLNDERTGPKLEAIFHCNMVIHTAGGAPWRPADYTTWLREAGFTLQAIEPSPPRSTLIYAV